VGGLLWALFAVILGGLLVYRFTTLASLRPRWAAGMLVIGAGTAVGIGLTSCLFFLMSIAVPRAPAISICIEITLLAWAGYQAYRRGRPAAASIPSNPFRWNLFLGGALLIALATATVAMTGTWDANPHGDWDAFCIWNLRARFLAAGGELAQRAWSPMLASHPEYPLLVSAFVARCWAYGRSLSPQVPIFTSYLFLLALLALIIGGVALLRSQSVGLLAGLALLGTPTLLHEVPAQYADVPLTCYFAGALILMLLNCPVLAGLCASMAAWTKDEGLLFLAVLFAATLVFQRRQVLRLAAGALPVSLLVVTFKALLPRDTPSILGNSMHLLIPKLVDLSRYGQIVGAFGHEFAGMAFGWYHPLLTLLVLAAVLRFDREHRYDLLFCSAICGSLMLGYFATYIITPYELAWHLQSSMGRLLMQLWPCLVLAAFVGLRTPESMAFVPVIATSPSNQPKTGTRRRRKARKTQG
jgi:hypothetical protein